MRQSMGVCFIRLFSLLIISPLANAQLNPIQFPQSCAKGQSIVIAAMGDILLHHPLQVKASTHGFESLWKAATPYIKQADIAYANLEGPIAIGINNAGHQVSDPYRFDYSIYTDYPAFNYHPRLAQDLKNSGFTIVSTANNHAFDRRAIGVDKTIDILDNAHVMHVGTHKSGAKTPIYKIIEKNGLKIAWIACTESTNNPDAENQMLYCYKNKDKTKILSTIGTLKNAVDAIIVAPHWGLEYQERANSTQRAFAHQVLEKGATAVIGSHPHVLQEVETYTTQDNRSTLISYSLGNFVSFQGSTRTRSTVILLLGLTKTSQGTIINGVRYVPMVMINRNGTNQIHLEPLTAQDQHLAAFQTISRAIPAANALFSLPIVTNPECQ
ncbi:MAG: CapA family protein [Proteobacteria bacterium]|nr:CapA family protein [Pseudomonadota bacterium]